MTKRQKNGKVFMMTMRITTDLDKDVVEASNRLTHELNEALYFEIAKLNKANDSNHLTHDQRIIIQSKKFTDLIEDELPYFYEHYIYDDQEAYDRAADVAHNIIEKMQLPNRWDDYIIDCFASCSTEANEYSNLGTSLINIEKADDFTSIITVSMKKGLKKREYIKAWDALSMFLEQPAETWELEGDDLERRMFIDHDMNGMSYGQIAEQYYPGEMKTAEKRKSATDKVKKRVKRYRKQREKVGTE